MKRITFIFLISVLLTSCSSVVFKNQQPKDARNLSSFPLEMQGMYTDGDKDTLIVRADGFYMQSMSDSKTEREFNLLSDSLVLRKGKKGYFLNMRDEIHWHVIHTRMDGKNLIIAMVDPEKPETNSKLANITSVQVISEENSSKPDYLIDPSVEEFEEMINAELFTKLGTFIRIKVFPDDK
jgi:hypothetical protein